MEALIERLRAGAELNEREVGEACAALLDERAGIEPRAEFLRALAARGETPAEIARFVRALLGRARGVEIRSDGAPLMDVCGTGGDRHGLFNISTAVMFVAAACGVRVVKHGNRGITSKSGGADVLEALGVRIELEPARVPAVLNAAGCVFLFAPFYHPAFQAVMPVRKALAERGIPTIFNKLGPLLNPAQPLFQLAGVFDPAMVEVYGAVFAELGRARAWAVHGKVSAAADGEPGSGLDEMSTLGATKVCAVENGALSRRTLAAADFGIRRPDLAELRGGDAGENASKLEALLRGKLPGAIEDIVLWNAAGALTVAGICGDLGPALERAREAIRAGEAAGRLEALRAATA